VNLFFFFFLLSLKRKVEIYQKGKKKRWRIPFFDRNLSYLSFDTYVGDERPRQLSLAPFFSIPFLPFFPTQRQNVFDPFPCHFPSSVLYFYTVEHLQTLLFLYFSSDFLLFHRLLKLRLIAAEASCL
jgi:hypothetical protein